MFVIINGDEYRENDIVKYNNAYGFVKGIIKYGEFNQDGSGGEYRSVPCYGWYVEFMDITPFSNSDETKEEIMEYYPEYEKRQSLLYLVKENNNRGNIFDFVRVSE